MRRLTRLLSTPAIPYAYFGWDRPGGHLASADGGMTWSALPNTTRATAITSFFFDDRTNTIFVGTYGRGLWKLSVDWITVHLAQAENKPAPREQAESMAPVRDVKVTYGPLVPAATDTSATITWSTSRSTNSVLFYGTSAISLTR